MGTIYCEICGTAYDDSEQECPVCGYRHNPVPSLEPEDYTMEAQQEPQDYPDLSDMPPMPGSTWDSAQEPRETEAEDPDQEPRKPIFDYDAVNPGEPAPQPMESQPEGYVAYEDLGDEAPMGYGPYGNYGAYPNMPYAEPPKKKQPVFLIIFLVILNVVLLAATGFLFFRYLLPGRLSEKQAAVETTAQVTETTVPETTSPSIPCTSLVMTSTGKVELNSEGQYWLIHAKAMPENTTDKILYFSEDDTVATVNEEGRVTAVGEGETKIAVVCGLQQMICPVKVIYKEVEETLESLEAIMPTQDPAQETKASEETKVQASEETKHQETEKPKKPIDPNITLKLKKTDILFQGMGLTAQLELDCELSPEDVEWTSAYPNIIKVENGKVTTLQYGASKVTAKYGDQEASCVVRCVKSN